MIRFRDLYMKKQIILYVIIVFLYIICKNIYLINNIPKEFDICIFDLILGIPRIWCSGNLDPLFMIVPCGIGFVIIIINLMEGMNGTNILLKNTFRKEIWKERFKIILKVSFIFSFIFVMFSYISSGFMIHDFSNKWLEKTGNLYLHINNENIWNNILWMVDTKVLLAILIILMFLGLTSLGIFIISTRLWFKKQYTYMITIVTITMTYFVDKINVFSKASVLMLYKIVEPRYIVYDIVTSLTIIVILYMIGEGKIVKKDFYNDIKYD